MNDAPREERDAENDACSSGLRDHRGDGARAVLGLERLAKTMAEVRLFLTVALKEHPELQNLW
eukprot:5180658-Amphidinium_carterae.1